MAWNFEHIIQNKNCTYKNVHVTNVHTGKWTVVMATHLGCTSSTALDAYNSHRIEYVRVWFVNEFAQMKMLESDVNEYEKSETLIKFNKK